MDRKQQIELTNMCLVYDENRILVEEKKGTRHVGGLVFPGGHVEPGESLLQSVIREMKEETGLDIKNHCSVVSRIGYKMMEQDIWCFFIKQISFPEN